MTKSNTASSSAIDDSSELTQQNLRKGIVLPLTGEQIALDMEDYSATDSRAGLAAKYLMPYLKTPAAVFYLHTTTKEAPPTQWFTNQRISDLNKVTCDASCWWENDRVMPYKTMLYKLGNLPRKKWLETQDVIRAFMAMQVEKTGFNYDEFKAPYFEWSQKLKDHLDDKNSEHRKDPHFRSVWFGALFVSIAGDFNGSLSPQGVLLQEIYELRQRVTPPDQVPSIKELHEAGVHFKAHTLKDTLVNFSLREETLHKDYEGKMLEPYHGIWMDPDAKKLSFQQFSLLDLRYNLASLLEYGDAGPDNKYLLSYADSLYKLSRLIPDEMSLKIAIEYDIIPKNLFITFQTWKSQIIHSARTLEEAMWYTPAPSLVDALRYLNGIYQCATDPFVTSADHLGSSGYGYTMRWYHPLYDCVHTPRFADILPSGASERPTSYYKPIRLAKSAKIDEIYRERRLALQHTFTGVKQHFAVFYDGSAHYHPSGSDPDLQRSSYNFPTYKEEREPMFGWGSGSESTVIETYQGLLDVAKADPDAGLQRGFHSIMINPQMIAKSPCHPLVDLMADTSMSPRTVRDNLYAVAMIIRQAVVLLKEYATEIVRNRWRCDLLSCYIDMVRLYLRGTFFQTASWDYYSNYGVPIEQQVRYMPTPLHKINATFPSLRMLSEKNFDIFIADPYSVGDDASAGFIRDAGGYGCFNNKPWQGRKRLLLPRLTLLDIRYIPDYRANGFYTTGSSLFDYTALGDTIFINDMIVKLAVLIPDSASFVTAKNLGLIPKELFIDWQWWETYILGGRGKDANGDPVYFMDETFSFFHDLKNAYDFASDPLIVGLSTKDATTESAIVFFHPVPHRMKTMISVSAAQSRGLTQPQLIEALLDLRKLELDKLTRQIVCLAESYIALQKQERIPLANEHPRAIRSMLEAFFEREYQTSADCPGTRELHVSRQILRNLDLDHLYHCFGRFEKDKILHGTPNKDQTSIAQRTHYAAYALDVARVMLIKVVDPIVRDFVLDVIQILFGDFHGTLPRGWYHTMQVRYECKSKVTSSSYSHSVHRDNLPSPRSLSTDKSGLCLGTVTDVDVITCTPTLAQLTKAGFYIQAFTSGVHYETAEDKSSFRCGVRLTEKSKKKIQIQPLSTLDIRYLPEDFLSANEMNDLVSQTRFLNGEHMETYKLASNALRGYYSDNIIKLAALIPDKQSFEIAEKTGIIPDTLFINWTWWTEFVIASSAQLRQESTHGISQMLFDVLYDLGEAYSEATIYHL